MALKRPFERPLKELFPKYFQSLLGLEMASKGSELRALRQELPVAPDHAASIEVEPAAIAALHIRIEIHAAALRGGPAHEVDALVQLPSAQTWPLSTLKAALSSCLKLFKKLFEQGFLIQSARRP